ncbi:MAG: hypothetical protein PHG05_01435 [Candidatus Nanoarchaeia archaeon]|nr:hypothetical protein [Candidatus Nanoarchaeia archaeon]
MKKEGRKERITISLNPQILKDLDDYCSKTKPLPTDKSPIIEIAIKEYLGKVRK